MSHNNLPSSPFKRKRSASQDFSSLPLSSADNPLSHPPSLLSQFSLAGLSETDVPPSSFIPEFPHRGFSARDRSPFRGSEGEEGQTADSNSESGEEGDAEKGRVGPGGRKGKRHRKKLAGEDTNILTTLIQSTHHFLSLSQIQNASRAYSLILALKPGGNPVDIRKRHIWALGAEILMRQGETPDSASEQDLQTTGEEKDQEQAANETGMKGQNGSRRGTRQRWGRSENMPRVKAYYESLIERHPWDHKNPKLISALDFWPALLSCEIYDVNMEHLLSLQRLDENLLHSQPPPSFSSSPQLGSISENDDITAGHSPTSSSSQSRLLREKNEIRIRSLRAMRIITTKMDGLMQDAPYSKSNPLLKLRAAAGMYISDLVVPLHRSGGRDEDGEEGEENEDQATSAEKRRQEMDIVRKCLQRVMDNGGRLNKVEWGILNPDNAENELEAEGEYVSRSLPFREPSG